MGLSQIGKILKILLRCVNGFVPIKGISHCAYDCKRKCILWAKHLNADKDGCNQGIRCTAKYGCISKRSNQRGRKAQGISKYDAKARSNRKQWCHLSTLEAGSQGKDGQYDFKKPIILVNLIAIKT